MADDEDSARLSNEKIRTENDSDSEEPVKLDLGIDPSLNFSRGIPSENAGTGVVGAGCSSNEIPRREDNPFSFKHFLRSDGANYQSQGARPKVYCGGRQITSVSDLNLRQSGGIKQTRVRPEYSSALPDFVQDHLVVEQCYLDEDTSHSSYDNDDNLPDFAPSRNNNRILNGESSRNGGHRRTDSTNNLSIPLDLPVRPPVGFPLDLPIAAADQQNSGSRSCPATSDGGVPKSLPDFLTDSAVRNDEASAGGQSPLSEIDRLQHDLELCRRQLAEETQKSSQLQRELESARNKEHEYAQSLVSALEQLEGNVESSNQRAAASQRTIDKLTKETNSLKNEISRLKMEVHQLRGGEAGPSTSSPDSNFRRFAQDLRVTANTAEHSLRQLLLGVDSLRMLANTMESTNRIGERIEVLSEEDGEDEATGHTL